MSDQEELNINEQDELVPKIPPKGKEEQISQSFWALVWWKFKKNKLAVAGGIIVALFYLICLVFAEFFAPYLLGQTTDYLQARPQVLRFVDSEGNFSFRPFVYGLDEEIDMELRRRFYTENPEQKYYLNFLVRGEPYKLLGFTSNFASLRA